MEIPELLWRIIISFVVLFTLLRILGRQEVSQMTFFNFVSAIALGAITANVIINQNLSILNGIIALAGWSLITLVLEFVSIKYKASRRLLEGEPIIVIKEGKMMEKSLRSVRLDVDRLNALLRQQNVFSVKDVDYAIFETSGKLSVLKKEMKQPVTKLDLNIPQTKKIYPTATEVISDGIVNYKNLSRLNIDEQWIAQQLHQAGVTEISEVFYAEMQQDGSLYIDKKNDHMVH